jgi:hypothetical protein
VPSAVAQTRPSRPEPTGDSPTTASGAGDARLGDIQTRANAAIARRIATLDADATRIASATHLTATDRQALANVVASDKSGLQALQTKIDSDTTTRQAIDDARTIVSTFRVYALVEPQVHLAIAADRLMAVTQEFSSVEARLQARIDAAKARGASVDAAQAALDDLKSNVTNAAGAVGPVPSEVTALQPAGYPGNRTTLVSAREALETARKDLKAALVDARTVVRDLESTEGAPSSSPTSA